MYFYKIPPEGGSPVTRLYLRYSYAAYLSWKFDPITGRYLRYQDTQEDTLGRGEVYAPLTDQLNGEQIGAENVVVLVMDHFHFY